MKVFVVLAFAVLAVSANIDNELWKQFKIDHGKTYKSLIEEKLRFGVFQQSVQTIEAHNAKFERGESSYKMGINQFSDLTPSEFRGMLNYKKVDLPISEYFVAPENYTVPTAIDWRSKGAVLGVKDQGLTCGSCWAFSTTGSLEGQNAIIHGKKVSLSEQELVDCAGGSYGNKGCHGGEMGNAFRYIQDKGISTESDYEYSGRDGVCKHPSRSDVKVTGFVRIEATEVALQNAVGSIGPISIAIYAELIRHYSSGIFDEPFCSKNVDHGVLAVGYGTQGKDFWIVKNSWGASWGENGYFRIVRNKNAQCGLTSDSVYPKIA